MAYNKIVGQTWDNNRTARRVGRRGASGHIIGWLADLIWDMWLAAFVVIPAAAGLLAIVRTLTETGNTMQAWGVIAWTFTLGICIALIGHGLDGGPELRGESM